MKRIITYCLLLVAPLIAKSEDNVYVGLHVKHRVTTCNLAVDTGRYEVWANGALVMELTDSQLVSMTAHRDAVKFNTGDTLIGKNFIVRFNGVAPRNRFWLTVNGDTTRWSYGGDLLVTARRGVLSLINIVDIDAYLNGVIKAEVGQLQEPEFIKAMVVVSRTYLLRNKTRHSDDGFDVCDHTHCQVYTGENDVTDLINRSVASTRGQVIVDPKNELVNAVFHANSGGQTIASELVWGSKVSYLRSQTDPYSRVGKQFQWEKRVPAAKWRSYLAQKTGKPVKEFNCNDKFVRGSFYRCNDMYIALRDIRRDMGLRSTYFIVTVDGDDVVFKGRGYGHGVGMSQEGANRMAELGYKYVDIIKFYYHGTHVVNRKGEWKASLREP